MRVPVVTVTLNAAIDQTVRLDRLVPGAVHRARSVRLDAGGKGINVASCLADWGVPVAAAGLLGRDNAGVFEALFAAKGIRDACARKPGETRTNVKLAADDDTTDINLPGLGAEPADLAGVAAAVREAAEPGALVLLAGSLPGGLAPDSWRVLGADLAASGFRLLLDTSGPALDAALAPGGLAPLCIKPNRHELEGFAGRPLPSLGDVAAAAGVLRKRGIAWVVVSLGAEGALVCGPPSGPPDGPDEALLARLPADPVSTVGAGDAMVAGIVAALAEGAGAERLARLGTAFAVGKLGLPGPNLPDRAEVERLAASVSVSRI